MRMRDERCLLTGMLVLELSLARAPMLLIVNVEEKRRCFAECWAPLPSVSANLNVKSVSGCLTFFKTSPSLFSRANKLDQL